MKVTVTSKHVNEKAWEKGARSGIIRTQEAQAETKRFRQTIRLDLGKDPPYEPGVYELDLEDNCKVGDFGDLQLARRPVMHRIEDKVAGKPAVAA